MIVYIDHVLHSRLVSGHDRYRLPVKNDVPGGPHGEAGNDLTNHLSSCPSLDVPHRPSFILPLSDSQFNRKELY